MRVFRPPDLFIAQDQPDFDWQGDLHKYCFPCMRYDPPNWDYRIKTWESHFRKLIIHPSEMGQDKTISPEVEQSKEITRKGQRNHRQGSQRNITKETDSKVNTQHKEGPYALKEAMLKQLAAESRHQARGINAATGPIHLEQ